jgi:hypothetical protein
LIGYTSAHRDLFSQTNHRTTNEFCCVAKQRNTSFFGDGFSLFKQTGQEFLEDKAPQLGAPRPHITQSFHSHR